jgi:hypothetical protein
MREKNPGAIPARQIITILTMVAALVAVIVLKSRCGGAMGNLFKAIDSQTADGGLDTQRRNVTP